ncbi:formate dehydrogenase subunit gamma [Campylobacter sputorum]|uniref:formate dehydrogenase subunit gamma n=1 Tax=Campylobacter sputorum TaxID=206 RepID=UPI00053BF82A|nr:formate dehydrogenase subunit gamma [Campylobacter sputorum]
MKKLLFLFSFSCFAFGNEFLEKLQHDSPVWAEGRIQNIDSYYNGFASFFVNWQSNGYFAWLAAGAIIAVVLAFVGHYAIVGPKIFSHHHGKIYAFNSIERLIHLLAAVAWVILVPTGLIIMFGDEFGGGFFVRLCKNLHGLATIIFAISLIPMFLFWFVRMLPATYDIKWMFMVGGYLSKNKQPIPAGKFNAGQKAWFWVATVGGFFMILTGASMFYLDYNISSLREIMGMSQIEILRLSAIIHNILGAACAVFLLVHIYMAVFAIKGSIHSIITGYKEEEEVYILHHYWYQELVRKGQIQKSTFENQYKNLA